MSKMHLFNSKPTEPRPLERPCTRQVQLKITSTSLQSILHSPRRGL